MDLKQMSKCIKVLSKLYSQDPEQKEKEFLTDRSMVMLIKAKTLDMKNVFKNIESFAEENIENSFKQLNYNLKDEFESRIKINTPIETINTMSENEKVFIKTNQEKVDIKSRIPMEYLTFAMELMAIFEDAVDISIKPDYPIKLENEQLIIIIAPRVEN